MLDNKSKVVFKNILGAFIVKGGGFILSFFTMPAYIKYFNNQAVLGVWFTMLSVLSWILSFDLGIGNGLRNKLVFAISKNDRKEMKEYISSAIFSISTLVVGIFILGITIIPFIRWESFFNIEGIISNKSLIIAMSICFLGICLQFIFNIVNSIYYALQLSAVNNFLSLFTSIIQLVCVLVIKLDTMEEKLIVMAITHVLAVILPLLLASIIVFSLKLKDCLPNIKYVSKEKVKQVIGMGGKFFICQVLALVMCAINELLVTSLYLPENVVEYHIYYKVFTLVSMMISLATTPLWSMITKAIAEKDYVWFKKTFKKMEMIILATGVAEFILIFASQLIVNIWLREEAININYLYASAFAFFGFMLTYTNIIATIVNGVGHLNTSMILMFILVIIKIILVFALKDVAPWVNVVFSTAIAYTPYCLIMHTRTRLYLNKKIKNPDSNFKI